MMAGSKPVLNFQQKVEALFGPGLDGLTQVVLLMKYTGVSLEELAAYYAAMAKIEQQAGGGFTKEKAIEGALQDVFGEPAQEQAEEWENPWANAPQAAKIVPVLSGFDALSKPERVSLTLWRCKQVVAMIEKLRTMPGKQAGYEFFLDVLAKIKSVAEGVNAREYVTERQFDAVQNWMEGVHRWYPEFSLMSEPPAEEAASSAKVQARGLLDRLAGVRRRAISVIKETE
jgi:hypothetical protein